MTELKSSIVGIASVPSGRTRSRFHDVIEQVKSLESDKAILIQLDGVTAQRLSCALRSTIFSRDRELKVHMRCTANGLYVWKRNSK